MMNTQHSQLKLDVTQLDFTSPNDMIAAESWVTEGLLDNLQRRVTTQIAPYDIDNSHDMGKKDEGEAEHPGTALTDQLARQMAVLIVDIFDPVSITAAKTTIERSAREITEAIQSESVPLIRNAFPTVKFAERKKNETNALQFLEEHWGEWIKKGVDRDTIWETDKSLMHGVSSQISYERRKGRTSSKIIDIVKGRGERQDALLREMGVEEQDIRRTEFAGAKIRKRIERAGEAWADIVTRPGARQR